MRCPRCDQPLADRRSDLCPDCLEARQKSMLRGARQGVLVGLTVGLVLAGIMLGYYGPERGIKAIAFGLVSALATTGLLLGMVRNR
ncbi:hypothetical protein AZSI13_01710 [Azospira sp. I13]|uniref:hypothetical protein n=1 Tax=Azospira sp. I13 TaxID=1765050 RepID=UPI000D419EAD|nr:hypothetical protein [Azospira sp. I13]GBG00844.1 hypothetical protein AZSI13_01710 [Azospira sp. I13]